MMLRGHKDLSFSFIKHEFIDFHQVLMKMKIGYGILSLISDDSPPSLSILSEKTSELSAYSSFLLCKESLKGNIYIMSHS